MKKLTYKQRQLAEKKRQARKIVKAERKFKRQTIKEYKKERLRKRVKIAILIGLVVLFLFFV